MPQWTAALVLIASIALLAAAIAFAARAARPKATVPRRGEAENFVDAGDDKETSAPPPAPTDHSAQHEQVTRTFKALLQRAPTPDELERYTAIALSGDADSVTRAVVRDIDTLRSVGVTPSASEDDGVAASAQPTVQSSSASPVTPPTTLPAAPAVTAEAKPIPADAFSRHFVETTVEKLQDSADNLRKAMGELQTQIDAVKKLL